MQRSHCIIACTCYMWKPTNAIVHRHSCEKYFTSSNHKRSAANFLMENGLYSFDAIEFILFMSFCMRLDLFLLIRVLSLRPTAWALISFILNEFRETKTEGMWSRTQGKISKVLWFYDWREERLLWKWPYRSRKWIIHSLCIYSVYFRKWWMCITVKIYFDIPVEVEWNS